MDDDVLQLIYNEDANILWYTSKEEGGDWENLTEFSITGTRAVAVGIAVSSSGIGTVFQGHQVPSYDNEEIYFCEIPKN